jgi:hypothetical protein
LLWPLLTINRNQIANGLECAYLNAIRFATNNQSCLVFRIGSTPFPRNEVLLLRVFIVERIQPGILLQFFLPR